MVPLPPLAGSSGGLLVTEMSHLLPVGSVTLVLADSQAAHATAALSSAAASNRIETEDRAAALCIDPTARCGHGRCKANDVKNS